MFVKRANSRPEGHQNISIGESNTVVSAYTLYSHNSIALTHRLDELLRS